ncbi:MAG: hypothetical protein AMXMBFR47_36940 [Planctomycetota bacterium]
MAVIRVLSQTLVNRIAAGECVERPASVVKELVENALDAGATRIDVAILDGGRELISVADDGVGMEPDDLRLSIHPHATSKIHADDDLFNILTMGFRGEALASIGSVSRLTITSRTRGSDVGHAIRVEGGEISGPSPCAAPPGTTVEVRDLFYAVPARRKFMKTPSTEMGHISEQFARIALAHPGVEFSLRHNERRVHDLRAAADPLQRIRDLFGPEVADVLIPVERASDAVTVRGYVAPPAEGRASNKWEYVFVNGRYVRDKFVGHAIKEAYRSLIDPSRYPMTFLFISIDPAAVDVNVHPTKIEVRWRDSNYMHGQVLATLREKFLATNLDHRLRAPGGDAYRDRVKAAMVEFFTRSPGQPEPAAESRPYSTGGTGATRIDRDRALQLAAPAAPAIPLAFPEPPPFGARAREAEPEPAGPADASPAAAAIEHPTAAGAAAPRAIQLHNTYLVAETADGLMLIDQHALHERILYEELKQRIADRSLESQRLLLPDVIRVPAERLEALETHAAMLGRLGIDLTASGPGSVTLHAFPSFLGRLDRESFVRDLLDRLSEQGARPAADTLLHELLDMMACKAAVKAGDPLTGEEIAALLARRETAERSSHCPHGRPTTLHFSLRELEKQFKRR